MECLRRCNTIEFCHSAPPRSTKHGSRLLVPSGSWPEGQISYENQWGRTNCPGWNKVPFGRSLIGRINPLHKQWRWDRRTVLGEKRSNREKSRHRRPRCNKAHTIYKCGQTTTRIPSPEDEPDIYWAIQRCSTPTIKGKNFSWRLFRKRTSTGRSKQTLCQ